MNGERWVYRRKAVFAETDAAGLVHFSRLLCWAEEAEHALLGELGLEVIGPDGGWPRVKMESEFEKPVGFGDEVRVELWLERMGRSSLAWAFELVGDAGVSTRGRMVTVRVDGGGKAVEIPQGERELLGRYLAGGEG